MRILVAGVLTWAFAAFAAAAPLPKELKAPALERLFGKPISPDPGCTFTLEGEKLILTMPANFEASATALKGAPRTGREVTGDFVAEAVVSYKPPTSENGQAIGGHFGAGIAVWENDENYALINRHHWPAGAGWSGGFDTHIHLPSVNPISHGATCEGTAPEVTGRLRITRKGDEFTTEESRDGGKTWNRTAKTEGKLPEKVNVGVVGFNTSKAKVEITFESLIVRPLK